MKRHKIVLYNPKAVFFTMPLALLAVGSVLDRSKYEVRIVDGRLERDPVSAVLGEIGDALCLGVTVLTGAPIRDALRLTSAAKARRPNLPIVWGGWHPSLFATATLHDEPAVDWVVLGQGEETFAEIVERLAHGERQMAGVLGCASRNADQRPPASEGGPPEGTSGHPSAADCPAGSTRPLRDINAFPAHNYALIPVERYFASKGHRQLDYVSSQGCRFHCAFCADPYVYNRRWFGLEPARVGEELAALWRQHRFEDVGFQDETLFTSHSRVVAIADEFLRRGLRFTWMATMRADQGTRLDEAALSLCRRAGLRRVMIGAESGSQQMLDWLNKGIRIEHIFDCADKCRRQGIAALFNFIVGFPEEAPESVADTLRVARRLRAMSPDFEVAISYYKPYPGSRIADLLLRQGHRFPRTLEEWATFDYVSSSGPWVTPHQHALIERFKFYQRIAWGRSTPLRAPLQAVARWRCEHDFYGLAIEKAVLERLKPAPRLS